MQALGPQQQSTWGQLPGPDNRPQIAFVIIAVLLGLHGLFIRLLGERFAYEVDFDPHLIVLFVAAQFVAGAVFLALLSIVPALSNKRLTVYFMLVTGLGLRLLSFGSEPILEVDFYRYLWDGGMLANGHNPYRLSPDQVVTHPSQAIRSMAQLSGPVVERINYPELRTIYPPLAQIAFAGAHCLQVWSLDAWRVIILACECASVSLLLLLLNNASRSPLWAALYWWNPLIIKELMNSAHMDALLVPLLLATLWFAKRQKPLRAITSLTLASGVKLWPLILLPLILRGLKKQRRTQLLAGTLLLALSILFVAPLFYFGLGDDSGLSAYAQYWQRNTSVFRLLTALFDAEIFAPLQSQSLARIAVALFIAGAALLLARRNDRCNNTLARNMIWLTAALFLLSPTQYPWYFIWFAPLLCLHPTRGLLVFTPLLSLYYLRFYFAAHGRAEVFDELVVWLQFIPVWALLFFDWRRARHRSLTAEPHV